MSACVALTSHLSVGYQSAQDVVTILKDINLTVHERQFICFLGPNGSGKSTLLKSLAGLLPRLEGSIEINGQLIDQFSKHALAQTMAVVLTDAIDASNFLARDVVALGRIPYTNWSGRLTSQDQQVIDHVINQVDAIHLSHKRFANLSDGEKQRILIARALAQEPKILILDEPTAHLDLTWRVEVMLLLRHLCHQNNLSIVMSTHDFELALSLADHLWLIDEERRWHSGLPEQLALSGEFERLFSNDHISFELSSGRWKINHTHNKEIFIKGDGISFFWTQKLAQRLGFKISQNTQELSVEVVDRKGKISWIASYKGVIKQCDSLKSLSDYLFGFTHLNYDVNKQSVTYD